MWNERYFKDMKRYCLLKVHPNKLSKVCNKIRTGKVLDHRLLIRLATARSGMESNRAICRARHLEFWSPSFIFYPESCYLATVLIFTFTVCKEPFVIKLCHKWESFVIKLTVSGFSLVIMYRSLEWYCTSHLVHVLIS